jgi:hypothetical protein
MAAIYRIDNVWHEPGVLLVLFLRASGAPITQPHWQSPASCLKGASGALFYLTLQELSHEPGNQPSYLLHLTALIIVSVRYNEKNGLTTAYNNWGMFPFCR